MTNKLKFGNISGTTADISLGDDVRLGIREDHILLKNSAGDEAPDNAIATLGNVRAVSGHLFEIVAHNGPISSIPLGCIPANGQKIYEHEFPSQCAQLTAGKQFIVTEVEWQSGVSGNTDKFKGCWSLGGTDENGRWFRVPKLNADTNYRAPFLRGSQPGIDAGSITDDRIRNITANLGDSYIRSNINDIANSGAFSWEFGTALAFGSSLSSSKNYVRFDASRVVPTGPENSPRYHGILYCIRMFGSVTDLGSLDARQLATNLTMANMRIAELESDIGFTILYPNGGTEAAPAIVGTNQRYVLSNPFPGYHVLPVAQVLYNGVWGESGHFASNMSTSYYVKATHYVGNGLDQVVVRTGVSGLMTTSVETGNAHQVGVGVSNLPARVIVFKIGGRL